MGTSQRQPRSASFNLGHIDGLNGAVAVSVMINHDGGCRVFLCNMDDKDHVAAILLEPDAANELIDLLQRAIDHADAGNTPAKSFRLSPNQDVPTLPGLPDEFL